jgi:hypothetical protein
MPILLALPSSAKFSTALPRSGGQDADSPDERARLVQNVDGPGSVLPWSRRITQLGRRPGAIYSTPGNSLLNLEIPDDVPVVSVPQLGHAVTDRSAWDGVH